MYVMHFSCIETKLPNLELKTRPKQLLGSLLIDRMEKLAGDKHSNIGSRALTIKLVTVEIFVAL
jgi:hypothetical protein